MNEPHDPFFSLPFSEQLRRLDQTLNSAILPKLQADGGGIQMMGLDEKTVYLHYTGACHGCAYAATSTLQFIRETLQRELSPEILIELS